MSTVLIAAFYKFVELPEYADLQAPILELAKKQQVKGSILLATEGINATLAAAPENLHAFLNALQQWPQFSELQFKYSEYNRAPFRKLKVRLKKEIVTLKPDQSPMVPADQQVNQHIDINSWEELLQDPDTLVVDARNIYEIEFGTFKGATNPQIEMFSELPAWLAAELRAKPYKKVAMFCTGGIRCEKLAQHLDPALMPPENVYQLGGGILNYLQETKNQNGHWQGQCFIFDKRVALNDQLEGGEGRPCDSCGKPLEYKDLYTWQNGDAFACLGCRGGVTQFNTNGQSIEHKKQLPA